MNWLLDLLAVAGSIALLAVGARFLVSHAAILAARWGVSELVIGLTVVALGTSAPELAVSLNAALAGNGDIAIANVIGSNIFNLGFILGGCALFGVMPVAPILVRREGPILIVSATLLYVLITVDGQLGPLDAAALLGVLAVYLVLLFRGEEPLDEPPPEALAEAQSEAPGRPAWFHLAGLAASIGVVIGGSELLVEGATGLARLAGASDWLIGSTVVAAGTSTPELATALVAAMSGRAALGIGALIGTDIFNQLGVLGVTGLIGGPTVEGTATTGLALLLGTTLLLWVVLRTGWRITRLEGATLVCLAAGRWAVDAMGVL